MFKHLPYGRKTLKTKAAFWVIATLTFFLAVCIFLSSQLSGSYHCDLAAKYSHAAVWSVLPGYEKSDGSRSYPVSAMVANLAKATPEKPALMLHDDVVTFFHEMGHAFHGLLSKTKFSRFHGTRCVVLLYLILRGSLTLS